MGHPRIPTPELMDLIRRHGVRETSRITGMHERKIYERRATHEKQTGVQVVAGGSLPANRTRKGEAPPGRVEIEVPDGVVLAGSDAHYWPGQPSTAHRAFLHFIEKLKPKAIVLNGDMVDGASISRHPPLGWEKRPSVVEELEICKVRLGEIADASDARLIWTLGNHDARFETRLATQAPEYANVNGFRLKDHFPKWEPCLSVWINDDLVIKHRFKGGLHSTFNGTLWAGKSIANGHLHSSRVTPFTDYNGDRYGIDLGCMAETYGPQFAYAEDNPRNWRSGFGVFTFRNGELLWPELVHVRGPGEVEFRGEVIEV